MLQLPMQRPTRTSAGSVTTRTVATTIHGATARRLRPRSERRILIPEAPEIREQRDQLQILVGKKVTSAYGLPEGRYARRMMPDHGHFMMLLRREHLTIATIVSHGKFMHWRFDDSADRPIAWLHCTHGMTGQWTWDHEEKFLAFAFRYFPTDKLLSESFVFFRDQRRFGTLKFVFNVREHEEKLASLAPCVFDRSVPFEEFAQRAREHGRKIVGEALMDQRALVAGVGNYMRAEILYDARISPHRTLSSLDDAELARVWNSMHGVADASYASKGATFRTHRNLDGSSGTYTSEMKVYGKRIDPLGNDVVRVPDSKNRTMWWVPVIQR